MGTINKIKAQSTDQKKIPANRVTDKGFISKRHQQLLQLHTKITKPPSFKIGPNPNFLVLQDMWVHAC